MPSTASQISLALGWLDARTGKSTPGLAAWAEEVVPVRLLDSSSWRGHQLAVPVCGLAVEFDYPQPPELAQLRDFLAWSPRYPVVMFTLHHSESLAVWAFRIGVADYIITPISKAELTDIAVRFVSRRKLDAEWIRTKKELELPTDALIDPPVRRDRTEPAIRYLATHLATAMRERTLADMCHMSTSEFSRVFHREHGESFRSFLLRTRMENATKLLSSTTKPISSIAFEVGFGGPSEFGRQFRRSFGKTPSDFRGEKRSDSVTSAAKIENPATDS
jgi:AraC-like DNA-binding protein